MDRVMVFDGALPQTTDVLSTNKFQMFAQAFQNSALLGNSTWVAGLACNPTTPSPTLQVVVSVGSMFQIDPADQNAYADLGTDTTSLLKQAILSQPVTLTITPPGTAGQSQVYLIQAILNDVDSGSTTLSYFNSVTPSQPFSGPANSGQPNFTVRQCQCVIALKAGVAATTGTQVTPSPDPGFTGLYAVTVVNGQTQITSPNIVTQVTAPFFPPLPSVPSHVLKGDWIWGTDTGTANTFVLTTPTIPSPPNTYNAGMGVRFKAANANYAFTTSATIQAGGSGGTNGTQTVTVSGGTLAPGGAATQLSVTVSGGAITAILSVVTPGLYSVVPTNPAAVTGAGLTSATVNLTISSRSTVNVDGLGVVGVKRAGGSDLVLGDIISGQVVSIVYDGTVFQMDNYLGISAGSTTNNFSTTSIPYVADTGTTNALIGTYSPAIQAGQQVAGLIISIKLANTITGACTINVNGLGVKNLDIFSSAVLSATPSSTFGAGEILILIFDGTEYQVISSSGIGGGGVGPPGPQGAQGPAGPQGAPGTFPTTPGAVGSFALCINSDTSGANVSGGNYPGTWQGVSFGGDIVFTAFTGSLFLTQRVA